MEIFAAVKSRKGYVLKEKCHHGLHQQSGEEKIGGILGFELVSSFQSTNKYSFKVIMDIKSVAIASVWQRILLLDQSLLPSVECVCAYRVNAQC